LEVGLSGSGICGVALKGTALLCRVQRYSAGCSITLQGVAWLCKEKEAQKVLA